jgi:hypothetical protein
MITELTQAQRDKIPEYVDKWIKIGTSTEQLDYDTTVDIVHNFQEHILKQEKTPVVVVKNPLEAWVACKYAEKGVAIKDLVKQVDRYFTENLKGEIDISDFVLTYYGGMFSANLFAFYDYFKYECGIQYEKDFEYEVWKQTSRLGNMYNIFDVEGAANVCIISEKPIAVHLNANNVIHKDGGPAVEYAGHGDIKVFALNGVVVPQWLAETHSSKIDVARIKEITNADVKAEFIRKVGVERLLNLGKKVDSYENYNNDWWTRSQYELWDMSSIFEGIPYAPHVKMLNQTVPGVWHVEAVSPDCKTLEDALNERLGNSMIDIIGIA